MPKVVGGPSLHLTWKELMCHNGAPYPPEWRADRGVRLGEAFESVRAIWQRPIQVLSGYRTAAYNRDIGGADGSMHIQGLAVDLRPPDGVSVAQFHDAIVRLAAKTAIRGIGYAASDRGNYVHIDCRPGDAHVHWTY